MAIPRHFIDKRERELIFKIQNLAIEKYGSIRALARTCNMNRKIMDRLQMNGVYSLTSFSVIKLCYALHISPNQLYGFEPLPEVVKREEVTPKNINSMSYRQIHHKLNDLIFRRKEHE